MRNKRGRYERRKGKDIGESETEEGERERVREREQSMSGRTA